MTIINHSDHDQIVETRVHEGAEPSVTAFVQRRMTLRVPIPRFETLDDADLHQVGQDLFVELLQSPPGTDVRTQHDSGVDLWVPRGGTARLDISEREQLIHDLVDAAIRAYEDHIGDADPEPQGALAGDADGRTPARADGGAPPGGGPDGG